MGRQISFPTRLISRRATSMLHENEILSVAFRPMLKRTPHELFCWPCNCWLATSSRDLFMKKHYEFFTSCRSKEGINCPDTKSRE